MQDRHQCTQAEERAPGKQGVNNRQARRPRAAHGQRIAAKDTTSESDEGEADRADWSECYGVRMSPANPRILEEVTALVGGRWCIPYLRSKHFFTCGRGVMYTIPEIKAFLHPQPYDVQRWLTTSQMGWALTRERNKITNEKDERDGKPVAKQLAPMISKFIRAQWESHKLECIDGERRQILEEAAGA